MRQSPKRQTQMQPLTTQQLQGVYQQPPNTQNLSHLYFLTPQQHQRPFLREDLAEDRSQGKFNSPPMARATDTDGPVPLQQHPVANGDRLVIHLANHVVPVAAATLQSIIDVLSLAGFRFCLGVYHGLISNWFLSTLVHLLRRWIRA